MEHVGFMPKNCGRLYAQEEDKSVILHLTARLLPEEEATEFAKYYHLGACEPSEEARKMLRPGMEMDAKNAFLPDEVRERMLRPGYAEHENGFCVMENGVVYAALLTKQPGVNDETMGYFMNYFTPEPEDLFYKIWCPGTHYRLYPDLSVEDMGWGPLEVRTTGFFPQQGLGIFDDPAEIDPDCISIMGMNMEVVPLGAPEGTEPLRIMEVSYERQTGEGREIRHRFWIGVHFIDGKAVCSPLADREKAVDYALKTALHAGTEFATLGRNIARFYHDRHSC